MKAKLKSYSDQIWKYVKLRGQFERSAKTLLVTKEFWDACLYGVMKDLFKVICCPCILSNQRKTSKSFFFQKGYYPIKFEWLE